MDIFIGIDPGVSGAVAVLDGRSTILALDWTPTIKPAKKGSRREYVIADQVALLRGWVPHPKVDPDEPRVVTRTIVALEKIHSMPAEGVASSFKGGEGFGIWKGIITALGLPLELVTPQAWKKAMMAGMSGDKGKGASRIRAKELWPKAELNLVKDHNKADALLIAEHMRRIHIGGLK